MTSTDAIYMRCPRCRKRLRADASRVGQPASCPTCGAGVLVPDQSTAMAPEQVAFWWRAGVAAQVGLLAVVAVLAALRPVPKTDASLMVEPAGANTPSADPAESVRAGEASAPELGEGFAVSDETRRALETENRRIDRERRRIQSQYEDLMQWILDNVRGTYPVPERLVDRLDVAPVTEAFEVNPDLVDLLRLEPGEVSLMNDAFQFTRETQVAFEQELVEVTQVDPSLAVLRIPPYPEEGEALQEDLYLALEATLGPARMDRMIDVSEDQLRRQFNHFGRAERSLAFEVIETPDGSIPPYLLIRDSWTTSDDPSTRKTEATETAVFELPPSYADFTPWLPETIRSYASP